MRLGPLLLATGIVGVAGFLQPLQSRSSMKNLSPLLSVKGAVGEGMGGLLRCFGQLAVASSLCLGVASPSDATGSYDASVYWGVGCFWHVQHEFVSAEKNLLGRTDDSVSSLAGYAGGNKIAKVYLEQLPFIFDSLYLFLNFYSSFDSFVN